MIAAAVVALLLTAAPVAPAVAAKAAEVGAAGPLAVEVSRFALPRDNWQQMLAQTEEGAVQAMVQSLQDRAAELPPGMLDMMQGEMRGLLKELMPSYEEMVDFQAGLLAKHYTAAELKQLLAFYRTPLGQKMIRTMPELMQDVMGWFQASMGQKMPPAMDRLQVKVKAWMEARQAKAQEAAPAEASQEKPAR